MGWTLKMLIKTFQGRKFSAAKIALKVIAIPGSRRRNGFYTVVSRHREHRASDDIVAIKILYHGVHFGAVQARRTSPGF